MKNNNQNAVVSIQPSNLLSLILFFTFGLSFGILLTFQLKNVSYNFPFNDFPSAISTASVACNPSESPAAGNTWLEDFISPSKVNHNMSDEELIWRASMVPKVGNYPYDRFPKVAFMFLTRGPVVMSPFWEKFFKGHNGLYTIYVHSSDLSSNWTETEDQSVFHGRKVPS